MKFVINKNILETMLSNGQNFLNKKNDSEITSHVLLHADGLVLQVRTTDFEMGLSSETSNVQIAKDGSATANGAKLLNIIKILKDGNVTLEEEDGVLHVKQGRSKFKLPMFNTSEFPSFPLLDNKQKLNIETSDFLKSLKLILTSVDSNNPKYELNGALIDVDGTEVRFVATDTRRLSIVKLEQTLGNVMSLIIPKKAVTEMEKLFFDDMELFYDQQMLICKNDSFTFFTKLINGKYPNYQRIIPENYKEEIHINKASFTEHLKQISSIYHDVKVSFSSDFIKFESLVDDNSEAVIEMDFVGNDGLDISFGVTCKFVLDFLKQVNDDEITLLFNDAGMPFTLKSEKLTTVVMPLML